MNNVSNFVESNASNVSFELPNMELTIDQRMAFEDAFYSLLTCDEADDSLMPVMVYLQDEQPVAWYNMETSTGYVTPLGA